MSYFSGSKKITVGLDIENDSVKMVKLRHTPQGPKLMGFGIAELSPSNKDLIETRKKEISSAIEKILTEEKIKGKRVISFISGPSVHIWLAKMPSLPAEKLEEAIKWMVKEKAPFDLEETTLDYSVLDKVTENGAQKVEVVAVVAKNKVIREKMDLLKRVGLKSAAMDVASLALLNSFKVNNEWKKDEIIALVDIEANTTHLAIVKNAKLEFSREITFGGDTITESLRDRLNLSDLESAQKMRERYGILDEDSDKGTGKSSDEATDKAFRVSQIIKIELGKLVSELRLSFNSYRAQCLKDRIDRIALSGSLAQLKNLDKFLAASLKVSVEMANPLDKIPLDSKCKKKRYQQPQFLSPGLNIATGLALGKGEAINLSPAKERWARSARRTRTILLPSLYFVTLLLLLATGYDSLNQKAAVYEKELQSKKAKITSLQPKFDRFETLVRDLNRWNERYTSIIRLRESSIPWVPVLAQFSEAIPEKAWLRELSLKEGSTDPNQKKDSFILMIRGSIKWEKLVAELSLVEFIRELEKSPYLNDVRLQSTDRNTRYGHEVIDFSIAAHLPRREEISSSTYTSGERVERSGR
ncbi:type IV pilus assembly protein PilM [Candidatus Aerophobetes bacterium]|uniref:Type IV pilus assembly protein PilM n=1 Tax=Aerophobetes bacterium TaxID=2030807 RepID=A0A523RZ15_UNCAE|nr:MAG: type IV pilus assembly protein PilM [Candidatus Aerophobetes bacterium]